PFRRRVLSVRERHAPGARAKWCVLRKATVRALASLVATLGARANVSAAPPPISAAGIVANKALTLLERLTQGGVFSELDYYLPRSLLASVGESSEDVALCAALASRAVQQGHVCVQLHELGELPLSDDSEAPAQTVALPPAEQLIEALRASRLC